MKLMSIIVVLVGIGTASGVKPKRSKNELRRMKTLKNSGLQGRPSSVFELMSLC
jgi:hypothetical protein